MINKGKIIEYTKRINKNSPTHNTIVNLVLNELLEIEFEHVNQEKSNVNVKENLFELYLYSKFDNPSIYIYIENITVEIQICQGAQFFELKEMINDKDIIMFKQVLKDLFYSPIQEKLIFKGNKIVAAKYHVALEDINQNFNFSIYFSSGINNIFKKKNVVEHTLKAWLC